MHTLLRTSNFLKSINDIDIELAEKKQKKKEVQCDFCYFTCICVAAALILLLIICTAELIDNYNEAHYFQYAAVLCAVCCIILLVILGAYTLKYGYMDMLCTGLTCDMFGLIVVGILLLVFVHASSSARGLIFYLISIFDPTNHNGVLNTGVGIVPSLAVNDTSLRDGYATLTLFAQKTIIDHQRACDRASFIVANFEGMGMSAKMHFYALVLGRAIEEGKVFAWGNTACANLFGGNCREFFMDEHGCASTSITPDTIAELVTDVNTLMHAPVPKVFRDVLAVLHPSMTYLQLMYWWKTQAVSYLMRFNQQTQAELNAMRADPTVHPGLLGVMPPHTINIQMRRGDKYDEMLIPSVHKYIDRAAQLFDDMPLSFSRWVFLTGDDPASLEHAAQLARDRNWGVFYSIYPRMEKGFVLSSMSSFGWGRNATLTGFMDLDMAMDCAAWLGTRASGWSRLFDEFRCTKVPKCQNIYIEIGSLPSGQYAPQLQ